MAKYLDALTQSQHENKRLTWMFWGAVGVAVFAMFGWRSVQTNFTVHLPPDLRSGASIQTGARPEVPDTTVYTFAFYIWQQLNRWSTDGTKDYGDQIFNLQAFVTPACREQLVADMNQRSASGELSRRTRTVMEIQGMGFIPERVVLQGSNAWKVLLDTQIQESQSNVLVKDTYIRYPLRVVRYDVDRERNPWQLALDCFAGEQPARLDPKAVAVARAGRSVAVVRETPGAPKPTAATVSPPAEPMASTPAGNAAATPAAIYPATLPQPTN